MHCDKVRQGITTNAIAHILFNRCLKLSLHISIYTTYFAQLSVFNFLNTTFCTRLSLHNFTWPIFFTQLFFTLPFFTQHNIILRYVILYNTLLRGIPTIMIKHTIL